MKNFEKASALVFGFTGFFLPAFFLVFPGNVFPATRFLVFFVITVIFFVLWGIKNFLQGGVSIVKGNFYLPLLAFFGICIYSFLSLRTIGAMNDAIFGTGGIMILFLFFFVAFVHTVNRDNSRRIYFGLAISSVFLAVLALFSFFPISAKLVSFSNLFSGAGFITGESAYYLLAFFLVTMVFGVSASLKKSGMVFGMIAVFSSIIGILVLTLNYFKVGNSAVFLPFSSGWAMTIELFKNIKNLLLGIGFNQFGLYSPLLKTPELNAEQFVFLRFPQVSNGVLELLDSIGVLGLLAFSVFIFAFYKAVKQTPSFFKNREVLSAAAVLVSFLLFLLFIFLGVLVFELKEQKAAGFEEAKFQVSDKMENLVSLQMNTKVENKLAPIIFGVFFGGVFLIVFFFKLAYPVLAEVHFSKYLSALLPSKAFAQTGDATSDPVDQAKRPGGMPVRTNSRPRDPL